MGDTPAQVSKAPVAPPRRIALLAGAGVVALATCAVTLWAAGALDPEPLPGIPMPSALVTWLVPILRLVSDGAAVLTVGCLLAAAVFVPGGNLLSATAYFWVRTAGCAALVWAVVALISLPVLLADFLGTTLPFITLRGIYGFVTSIEQGRAQLLVVALALLVALAARTVLTPAGAKILLVVALTATIPPAFSSHTTEEASHSLAVTSAAFHVIGVTLWAGGLLALMLARRLSGPARVSVVERFSRLAAPLALLVAASGVLTSITRLSELGQLLTTSYGVVLLVKTAAFIGLVAIGWWHRRITLPALRAARPRAFGRLAGAEVLIFAATIGLAVGLARTPTPAVPATDTVVSGPAVDGQSG